MAESDDFKYSVPTRSVNAAMRRLELTANLAEHGVLYGNIVDIGKAITQAEHAIKFLYRAHWGATPR